MLLTIWTKRGCDCSKPSTEDRNPLRDSSRLRGFCCWRVASWVEVRAKWAMLLACSPWV